MRTSDNTLIKVPSTTLPEGMVLSTLDRIELFELEQAYKSPIRKDVLNRKYNISRTRNVGVHYFCLEQSFELPTLVSNSSITENFAYLLFAQLENNSHIECPAMLTYSDFLCNPIVYGNLDLFEEVFDKTVSAIDGSVAGVLETLAHLAPYLPVDSLMFTFSKIAEGKDDELSFAYSQLAYFRNEEVFAWIETYRPDLANLPLNWILKAYGFSRISNKANIQS